MVEVAEQPKKKGGATWAPGHQYGLPCKCTQACGQKKLKYLQPDRPVSFKPHRVYMPTEGEFPDRTTYKLSYEAFDPKLLKGCRGVPVFIKENLVSAGEFYDKTTHKMSYGPWPGLMRPKQIYPRDHKLGGEGPISEMTTNRHDYTPKPIETSTQIIQAPALGLSTAKMEGDSVQSMSYRNPDMSKFTPPQSFKPAATYLPPEAPMDGETVHKLSYLPWDKSPEKMDMPWADQAKYSRPCIPFEGNTVYNGSYIPPGRLVEDQQGHCMGCYCMYPAECFDSNAQPPKDAIVCPTDYNPNTDPPRPPP
ncbi:Hypothetical protein NTJ_14442 [Nesidiocoris tenuis]|uniref:Uncharacterized protein n=1 Tax=Nesidiocoris tenuis TaxID=355587 RepID=A0ABN7BD69_9HEMI|nr:Hypothetical protein NTJ_14442 [Nesidiocoris tenuis]